MDALEGPQELLQAVGEHNGRGGIGQQEGAGDEEGETEHHKEGGPEALHCDPQEIPLPQNRAGSVENIEQGGEHDDEQDWPHAPEEGRRADLGHGSAGGQHQKEHGIAHRPPGQKEGDDIEDGAQELGPGVQPVDGGVSREILPQSDVTQGHQTAPFRRRKSRTASRACGMV